MAQHHIAVSHSPPSRQKRSPQPALVTSSSQLALYHHIYLPPAHILLCLSHAHPTLALNYNLLFINGHYTFSAIMPTTRKQPLLSLQPNQLHTTSSRILITLLFRISILPYTENLRKPNNSSLLETLILFHNENSILVVMFQKPYQYVIIPRNNLIHANPTIHPLNNLTTSRRIHNNPANYFCISLPLFLLQTINNDLIESIPKIDSFPSRQFGSISVSLLHSLYSSLFYAMNVH